MDCLFCKIAAKEISSSIIYEDDHTLAFLEIHPRSPGHTMVIPKVHAPTLVDLPDAEVGPLFAAVKKVAALLKRAPLDANGQAPDGITIGMNQGRASGQEVDHLHVHLMPRWHNDGGSAIQSVVNNPPQESREEILKQILNQ
jgi:histidine triad (HIT) family protein